MNGVHAPFPQVVDLIGNGCRVRYFYDCEFVEDGRVIDLISIGVVAEDGREFYAVSTEFDANAAGRFVRTRVLPALPHPGDPAWSSRREIRDGLERFLRVARGSAPLPELWAWKAAYDHVALVQLWGDMTRLPRGIPRFTHELCQRWEDVGRPPLPPRTEGAHDALVDARRNLAIWRVLEAAGPPGPRGRRPPGAPP